MRLAFRSGRFEWPLAAPLLVSMLLSVALSASAADFDPKGSRPMAQPGFDAPVDRLIIEGGPFLPFRLARASVVSEAGIIGRIRISGLLWDGGRRALFEGDTEALAGRVETAFFLDGEIKSLVVEARGPSGEMSGEASVDPSSVEEEASIAALGIPYRGSSSPLAMSVSKSPPLRLALGGGGLQHESFVAASRLFVVPLDRRPLYVVFGYALLAALIASLRRRERVKPISEEPTPRALPRGLDFRFVALGLTAIAASATLIFGSPPEASLFSAAFPSPEGGSAVSGELEGSFDSGPGYKRYSWGDASSGALLIGLYTPNGSSVPLELIEKKDALYRFEVPPLVRLERDELVVVSPRLRLGWRLHGRE